MDIRKLQRAIVDGLEDVKAQHISVFNTEHLSSMFERVIIASGTSNRQTKALAASVRDSVRKNGFPVLSTEGEDNGEWIIVDCGAAVVHVMQPAVRQYYHLEEIWGDKPVRMKVDSTGAAPKLVKASEDASAPARKAARKPAAGRAAAPKAAAGKVPARKATAKKAAPARKATPAGKPGAVAKKASARPAAARPTTTAPARKKPAAKKAPARKAGA
jgi:ribosome-associated protein